MHINLTMECICLRYNTRKQVYGCHPGIMSGFSTAPQPPDKDRTGEAGRKHSGNGNLNTMRIAGKCDQDNNGFREEALRTVTQMVCVWHTGIFTDKL